MMLDPGPAGAPVGVMDAELTAGDLDAGEIRIVLVDARPERRAVIRMLLEYSDMAASVLGEASDEAEALAVVEQCRADLAIVDFQAPAQDGLDVVAALRARFPALVILVGSFDADGAIRERALAAGADAYVLKPFSARDIVTAVESARLTPAPS